MHMLGIPGWIWLNLIGLAAAALLVAVAIGRGRTMGAPRRAGPAVRRE